jgi:hypothetical protein
MFSKSLEQKKREEKEKKNRKEREERERIEKKERIKKMEDTNRKRSEEAKKDKAEKALRELLESENKKESKNKKKTHTISKKQKKKILKYLNNSDSKTKSINVKELLKPSGEWVHINGGKKSRKKLNKKKKRKNSKKSRKISRKRKGGMPKMLSNMLDRKRKKQKPITAKKNKRKNNRNRPIQRYTRKKPNRFERKVQPNRDRSWESKRKSLNENAERIIAYYNKIPKVIGFGQIPELRRRAQKAPFFQKILYYTLIIGMLTSLTAPGSTNNSNTATAELSNSPIPGVVTPDVAFEWHIGTDVTTPFEQNFYEKLDEQGRKMYKKGKEKMAGKN